MLLTRELCGYEITLSRNSHILPIVLQASIKFHLLPRLLPHTHPEGGTFVQSLVGASEKAAPGRKHNNWSRVGGGGFSQRLLGQGREVHVEWVELTESFGGAGGGRKIPKFEL